MKNSVHLESIYHYFTWFWNVHRQWQKDLVLTVQYRHNLELLYRLRRTVMPQEHNLLSVSFTFIIQLEETEKKTVVIIPMISMIFNYTFETEKSTTKLKCHVQCAYVLQLLRRLLRPHLLCSTGATTYLLDTIPG